MQGSRTPGGRHQSFQCNVSEASCEGCEVARDMAHALQVAGIKSNGTLARECPLDWTRSRRIDGAPTLTKPLKKQITAPQILRTNRTYGRPHRGLPMPDTAGNDFNERSPGRRLSTNGSIPPAPARHNRPMKVILVTRQASSTCISHLLFRAESPGMLARTALDKRVGKWQGGSVTQIRRALGRRLTKVSASKGISLYFYVT